MSQRVRILSCPWPERIGREGSVVPDPGDGIYPFNKRGTGEVVLLLDDDPLFDPEREGEFPRNWTCVMDAADIEFLGEQS